MAIFCSPVMAPISTGGLFLAADSDLDHTVGPLIQPKIVAYAYPRPPATIDDPESPAWTATGSVGSSHPRQPIRCRFPTWALLTWALLTSGPHRLLAILRRSSFQLFRRSSRIPPRWSICAECGRTKVFAADRSSAWGADLSEGGIESESRGASAADQCGAAAGFGKLPYRRQISSRWDFSESGPITQRRHASCASAPDRRFTRGFHVQPIDRT